MTDETFDTQCDDVVELHQIADTKALKALIQELDEYRAALGREPTAYAVFRKHMLGHGGINNAVIRHNEHRRAEHKPAIGVRQLRHHGRPILVRMNV